MATPVPFQTLPRSRAIKLPNSPGTTRYIIRHGYDETKDGEQLLHRTVEYEIMPDCPDHDAEFREFMNKNENIPGKYYRFGRYIFVEQFTMGPVHTACTTFFSANVERYNNRLIAHRPLRDRGGLTLGLQQGANSGTPDVIVRAKNRPIALYPNLIGEMQFSTPLNGANGCRRKASFYLTLNGVYMVIVISINYPWLMDLNDADANGMIALVYFPPAHGHGDVDENVPPQQCINFGRPLSAAELNTLRGWGLADHQITGNGRQNSGPCVPWPETHDYNTAVEVDPEANTYRLTVPGRVILRTSADADRDALGHALDTIPAEYDMVLDLRELKRDVLEAQHELPATSLVFPPQVPHRFLN